MHIETVEMFVVKNTTKKGATCPFQSILLSLYFSFQTHPSSTVVNFFKAA